MRIVVVNETFNKKMGYAENNLPKALARLGQEVHVVSSNVQAYFNDPDYVQTYEPFNGPAVQPCGVESLDGYTLHRLRYGNPLRHVRIKGLSSKLRSLHPDIVQTFLAASWVQLEMALAQPFLGYKLFTGAHEHASIFSTKVKNGSRWCAARLKSDIRRAVPGRLVSTFSEKCYATTIDCAEIAGKFYGVPEKKIDICPLGVDTDLFGPIKDESGERKRLSFRAELGFEPNEIVCIYTGRFSHAKNPLCLAEAIARLQAQGEPFRGLFVGDGPQSNAIQASQGCVVHPFVLSQELPGFYQAADIGVWPTQESTSMLDAAACGLPLPLVVSDRLKALERIEGNGVSYEESEPRDMMRSLLGLKDVTFRRKLGDSGAAKIAREYSWLAIAARRLRDYEAVLSGNSRKSLMKGAIV